MLNQIQTELAALDQAKFQKLGDAYFYRTLEAVDIDSQGSVPGRDKTRIGTPDTRLTLKNKKYVFIEYTTQKEGKLKKFSDDLDKCFDEKKTGIALSDVDKIVLSCNSVLSLDDKTKLAKKCQENGCMIDFLDLNKFSFELYQRFQPLAKEFLGIELDTGQILTPREFVNAYQQSKFATPLDNQFFFRVKEKDETLSALGEHDLVVISGGAGVGKSKLALECIAEFVDSNPTFRPYCISNKNDLDLYENLKAYFGPDGEYLVLVDDANRLSQLPHILRLLHEQTSSKKIKIVLTVRDYALAQVTKLTRTFSPHELRLARFSNEEISKILDEGFGIKNFDYVLRISQIANGNPRLAIMAGKIALETNKLESISDVSKLYDEYFSTINEDLKELGNRDLLKVAGLISFFRVLDRTNSEVFDKIANAFDQSAVDLWTGLEKLHELEIVDLDYEVAKISDQILGTYLFYKVFFKDEMADFSILLRGDFEKHSHRIVDALNPALSTFNATFIVEKLRPSVNARWNEIKDDEIKALPFIKLFHEIKETEFLIYLKQKIDSSSHMDLAECELKFTPEKHQPLTDKYLDVLRHFQGRSIETVTDLTLTYLEKRLDLLPQVIHLILEDFCFDHYSHFWNYYIQQTVVTKLIAKSKGDLGDLYEKILLQISRKYLQMRFHSNSSNGLAVTIHTFPLRPWEVIFEIREKLWTRLLEISQSGKHNSEIFKIIESYASSWGEDFVVKEIIEKDKEILMNFITSLDESDYRACVLAHTYFDFLKNVGISFNESIRAEFTNKTYEISEVLLTNDRRELSLGFEEYEKYRQELHNSYFGSYKFEDFKGLFEQCQEVQSYFVENREYYRLHYPLINILVALADRDKELFISVITYVLESGNPLQLAGFHIVHKLIEITPNPSDAYDLITKFDFSGKTDWLFGFFQSLKNTSVDKFFLRELYNLYRTASLDEIPTNMEFLEAYCKIDKHITINVIKLLFERVKQGDGMFNFQYFFNSHGKAFDDLETIFAADVPLLEEIYLYENRIERYFDYRSEALKKIIRLNRDFIFSYLDFLYAKNDNVGIFHDGNIDFSFVWERDDYAEFFSAVVIYIYTREEDREYFFGHSYLELFFRNLSDESREKALNILTEIFEKKINDVGMVSYFSQIVANCFVDQRKHFLAVFLSSNRNLEDFRRFRFETDHVIAYGAGELVSRYEGNIKFYESLLGLFDSPDLLEHKLNIEERINTYKEEIEYEKKNDFIGWF